MAALAYTTVVPIRPGVKEAPDNAYQTHGRLRVIAGGLDSPEGMFRRAYHEARIAQAEHALLEAKFQFAHHVSKGDAPGALRKAREAAHARAVELVGRVARLPAMNREQFRQKKVVIGKLWLRAAGAPYDGYRHAVTADAIRLGVKP